MDCINYTGYGQLYPATMHKTKYIYPVYPIIEQQAFFLLSCIPEADYNMHSNIHTMVSTRHIIHTTYNGLGVALT